ncbi:MAG: mercuric reductase [Aggregatilineales bacterium]
MQYDAIIIGSGQAATGLAVTFANDGEKTALIEGDTLGGTCLNFGCRPTKTLRASAFALHRGRRGDEYGFSGELTLDFDAVMARKDRIIGGMQDGFVNWITQIDNLDVIKKFGKFVGKNGDTYQVQAGDDIIEGKRIYINVGARAFVPPIPGLDTVDYMTSKELLALEELPDHMVIIGGGYIGLEFGQMFRRFGSNITIIEGASHIANREDTDISESITEFLEAEGINILTEQKATQVSQDDNGTITVTLEDKNGDTMTVDGSHLLVATGRRPNSDTLNLESVGIEVNERGYIVTNGKLETSQPNVWALGDVNGRGAFTHTAYQDYEIVLANHQGGDRTADGRIMAYAMFTDPPFGRVGMSEDEARESDKNVLMAIYQMEDISRAKLDSEPEGMIKLLVDADSEEFLGGMIVGFQGDDIIQIISNYMHTGASYKIMQNALPVHPTIAEFIPTILGGLKPLSEWDADR